MATHGGSRPGAGRPKGGVSDTRRLIQTAITKGLAHAGRAKYPGIVSCVDVEQDATDTAAMIVSDMIQAGRGNEVLKIWSQVALKDGERQAGESNSILANALARLPVRNHDADMTQTNKPERTSIDIKGLEDMGATDTKSNGTPNTSFFAPQASLNLDGENELPYPPCDQTVCLPVSHDSQGIQAKSAPAKPNTPHPPPGSPPPLL